MALTLTKEVKAPEISEKLLNEAIDNIYSLYLNIGKKARAYCDAVVKLGNACSVFDKEMDNLNYNGMSKRDFYSSITGRMGFGYNQFMKVKQIAQATKIVENKPVPKVYDLIDVSDASGFHLIIDGEKVPCTIDNLQRGIAEPKKTTTTSESEKVSALEKILQQFDKLDKMTANQTSELEGLQKDAEEAEANIAKFTEEEELAKTAKKNAKADLSSTLAELRLLKTRVNKYVPKKESEDKAKKEQKVKDQEAKAEAQKTIDEIDAKTDS